MLLTKWLPWNYILKRAARAYGFLDPVTLMAKLRRFGHPSEVQEPIELIRAGVVFHARGLINTRAIQYNLDWIWPYWIVKQFKPLDESFIPRGFSFSHVNLTHRNWTAVGLPDRPFYPIVDPKGLITPYLDGWSLDFWLLSKDNGMLIPSEIKNVRQRLNMRNNRLCVSTRVEKTGWRLATDVWVGRNNSQDETCIRAKAAIEQGGWLVLALRPYNPEGIQFIETIQVDPEKRRLRVNNQTDIRINQDPQKVLLSDYDNGDVGRSLREPTQSSSVTCPIGMATAAALFPIPRKGGADVTVSLPLRDQPPNPKTVSSLSKEAPSNDWASLLSQTAQLVAPDEKVQFLYDAALRTLLLLSADEIVPGPYTYKRFWFRDACLMIHALLGVGLGGRAQRLVLNFPQRQTINGYFKSQEGEWDSNGQVLWLAGRLHELTDVPYDDAFLKSIFKGADWIHHKRDRRNADPRQRGLFPPGFSAEHLGPNDYYYWDNFWGLAGLRMAAQLAGSFNAPTKQMRFDEQADAFQKDIMDSIAQIPQKRKKGGLPASPHRRMDAGAIGSLVADYPLQIFEPNHPMIMNTIHYLMQNCFHAGAFFQDMIHSGLNVYLTLAIAQTLLRAGQGGFQALVRTVADLASPTGQWPEAIHPFTKGGCMGDGQHGWAAAEWLMMMRNMFVREEKHAIIIGSGIFPEWINSEKKIAFGPTLIPGGKISVALIKSGDAVYLDVDLEGDPAPVDMVAAIPGYAKRNFSGSQRALKIESMESQG